MATMLGTGTFHPSTTVGIHARYREVRATTQRLAAPLSAEDCMVQSMPDASPTKWHLAHTSWFFETFVLARTGRGAFDPAFAVLFNSYYQSVGPQHPRPARGMLSRPSLERVLEYRATVDEQMLDLLSGEPPRHVSEVVELGLHHEQQHQELIVTDIKHALSQNPTAPTYAPSVDGANGDGGGAPLEWEALEGGIQHIGHRGGSFCFDNELPRHRTLLSPMALATRLVTNAEYLAFMDDGGYQRPELWLSEGWDWRAREHIEAPLYWTPSGNAGWRMFTLAGERPIRPHEPVVHVSLYEADAYARWAGARLPREAELEIAAAGRHVAGNFLESGALHPQPASPDRPGMKQLFGDAWEWTQSAYGPYPGYQPLAGALGEYNGKFMCNQYVLRGGSCASPRSHLRSSYRNFFPAHARWQMSGIRLARDS
jgi:ergothioneine biosynthesis protein EgtB